MTNPDSSTEYTMLREALYGWAKLNDRQDVWNEIEAVVTSLSQELGKVIRIHVPAANSYVALTFENEPTKIGAYVNVGHIDHIVKVDGSYVPEAHLHIGGAHSPLHLDLELVQMMIQSRSSCARTVLCRYRCTANVAVDGNLREALSCI